MTGIEELETEDISQKKDCNLCKEALLEVGKKTDYGAAIIFRLGKDLGEGWFATLSPRTGSNPEQDFTIQLMPFAHLTHFSQLAKYPELAKNYGIAFSKINRAMAKAMAMESREFKPTAQSKENSVSIANYGKCTNWKEKKEHLHIKVFPFRGNIGQPYTVDSSFGRKKVFKDEKGKRFVKMHPVEKKLLPKKRFEELSKLLIEMLGEDVK